MLSFWGEKKGKGRVCPSRTVQRKGDQSKRERRKRNESLITGREEGKEEKLARRENQALFIEIEERG